MKTTPILAAAFIAAGCSLALAQAGGGGGGGGGAAGGGAAAGAGGGTAAGTATGGDAGVSAGTAGASAGSAAGADSGVGGDQRATRSYGVYRRGDDMAPLRIPREEAPVRLRMHRQW